MRVPVVIIMGVTGSGKSTVARALASTLAWRFCDADDLHSPENVERMRRGIPLNDELRQPWLIQVRDVMASAVDVGEPLVVACSALKHQYRAVLTQGLDGVRFVHLTAPERVLRDRLRHRPDHFAGIALLDSQLAALEPPDDAFTVDATLPVDRLVELICDGLSLASNN